MTYFVCFNGVFIAERKTIKGALNYARKHAYTPENDVLYIVDSNGNTYDV